MEGEELHGLELSSLVVETPKQGVGAPVPEVVPEKGTKARGAFTEGGGSASEGAVFSAPAMRPEKKPESPSHGAPENLFELTPLSATIAWPGGTVPVTPAHTPVGDTGPALLGILAAGTAAGIGWVRRRRAK
jgi:hypothetical protein